MPPPGEVFFFLPFKTLSNLVPVVVLLRYLVCDSSLETHFKCLSACLFTREHLQYQRKIPLDLLDGYGPTAHQGNLKTNDLKQSGKTSCRLEQGA